MSDWVPRSITLRSAAIQLNNAALYFHQSNNLGVAAAMYPDALRAIMQHKHSLESEQTEKKQWWQYVLAQRKDLVHAYRNQQEIPGSEGIDQLHAKIEGNNFGQIRPITLHHSLCCNDDALSGAILFNMGLVHFQMEQLRVAVQFLKGASVSLVVPSQSDYLFRKTLASIHCVLGIIYAHQGRLLDSAEELSAVLRIRSSLQEQDYCEMCKVLSTRLRDTMISEKIQSAAHAAIFGALVKRCCQPPRFPWDEDVAPPAA